MSQKLLYLSIPLLLTGCIGSFFTGQTDCGEDYPDIRTVPVREEACAPRGQHEGEEQATRAGDLKQLEQDLEQIKARNEALREKAFPAKAEP